LPELWTLGACVVGHRLRNRPIENEYAAAMYKDHITAKHGIVSFTHVKEDGEEE